MKKAVWKPAIPLLYCMAASLALMMICNLNSYLYPLNPWTDVNCFVTVGKGMLEGVVPYRDLIEQKGPLLYAIHALGLLISPGNFHGVYLIEALLFGAALLGMWKTARLYTDADVLWGVVPCALLILCSKAFACGDSAEELCLPFVIWSLYDGLRSLHLRKRIPLKRYVLHGALAGCVLWIKFNLLAVHFAWMSYLAIHALVEDRKLRRPVLMCAAFLAGMALATAPWVIYFGANGAIADWLRVYIFDNVFHYHTGKSDRLMRMLFVLRDALVQNPFLMGALILGGGYAMLSRRFSVNEKGFLAWAVVIVVLAVYGRGVEYTYYHLAMAAFMPLALVLLGACQTALRRFAPGTRLAGVGCLLALALGTGAALAANENAPYINYPYEDTIQGQICAAIGDDPDVTILNTACLDGGFYFALDSDPVIPWFCALNVRREDCRAAQTECLVNGMVDYAVSGYRLEELGIEADYVLIGDFGSDYCAPCVGTSRYYLYRRGDLEI